MNALTYNLSVRPLWKTDLDQIVEWVPLEKEGKTSLAIYGGAVVVSFWHVIFSIWKSF